MLHINKPKAENWTVEEIIERWHQLYKSHSPSQRYQLGEDLTQTEFKKLEEIVDIRRDRLMDISWFMCRLNEFVSRQANYEDNCTKRF